MSIELKKLFLNDFHKDNSAKFVDFFGYSMPINYELGIIKEHQQVRSAAGIFDVSHMGQVLIPINTINLKSLEKFIPLNFSNLKMNKSYYSFLLNEKGGVIDDLIISKIFYKENYFYFIVYNSGRKNEDEKIFKNYLVDFKFLNNNSLLAIQGPESNNILNFLNFNQNMSFMENQVIKYLDELLIFNRSGYTGEDGFEISIPNTIVLNFIKKIINNKNAYLCGLGSRDSLRLEAGFSLYGNELNENISPIDANLSWSIHKDRLKDKSLNGHKFLLSQLKNGSKSIKIGLESMSKSILRSNMKLINIKEKQIGIITSGGYSPSLETSIAIGYIDSTVEAGTKIYSLIRGKIQELKIVKLPFVSHKYRKV